MKKIPGEIRLKIPSGVPGSRDLWTGLCLGLLLGIAVMSFVGEIIEAREDLSATAILGGSIGVVGIVWLLLLVLILDRSRSRTRELEDGDPRQDGSTGAVPRGAREDPPQVRSRAAPVASPAPQELRKPASAELPPQPDFWTADEPSEHSGRSVTPVPGRSLRQPEPPVSTVTDATSASRVDPGRLASIWKDYLDHGDGRFERTGLGRRLGEAQLDLQVLSSEELGISAPVLGVARPGRPEVFLLPDFNAPARAVAEWFTDGGSGDRTARIRRLIEVAEAQRHGGDLQLVRKGSVA